MTSQQRRISPGPSWTVLSQPVSSRGSPEARTSVSYYSDHELEADMGDDEAGRGDTSRVPAGPSRTGPLPSQTPHLNPNSNTIGINGMTNGTMAKRKAAPGTDDTASLERVRPPKVPRLDLGVGVGVGGVRGGATSVGADRPSSSSLPLSTPIQGGGKGVAVRGGLGSSPTEQRSTGSASTSTTSDFPHTLSQAVRKAVARDKERERERERRKEQTQTQGVATTPSSTTQRDPPVTARKHTAQAKNIRNVTTANLLKNAQKKPNDTSNDESVAWTRVRPKFKQKRTSYAQEMAHTQPLDMARQRRRNGNNPFIIDNNNIELTDSSDSGRGGRRRRPSQPVSALANKDDPIIITDSSDDDRVPMIRPTQIRGRGADRPRVPPPENVEVISIPDSDEDVCGRPKSSARPTVSAAPASTSTVNRGAPSSHLLQGVLAAPLSAPTRATAAAPPVPAVSTTAPVPIPGTVPASTSTLLPDPPPSTIPDIQQDRERHSQDAPGQEAELPPKPSPSPSYEPPPDDFDDPFDNMNFDTGGNDTHPSPNDALGGWDSFDMGSSLATLPVAVPSGSAVASVPEGAEDVSGSDALFDSYMNMDHLGGDVGGNQGAEEGAHPGGDGAGEQTEQDVVNSAPEASAREGSEKEDAPISGTNDGIDVDRSRGVDGGASGGGDVRMGSLEEGELDNDAPVPSARTPGSPKSGDIGSQKSTWTLESGEIRSQQPSHRVETPESGEIWSQQPSRGAETPEIGESSSRKLTTLAEVRRESRPPTSYVSPRPAVALLAPLSASTSLSPSSASPRSATSQSLGRTRTLFMPDISSYKGVRFKRMLPEAWENPFFSRALSGSMRPGRAPTSATGAETSVSGNVTMPVDMLTSDNKEQCQDGDADMQDDAVTSMPEPSTVSSPKAAVPTLTQPVDAPVVADTQSIPSTDQAIPLTAEPSTTANDDLVQPPSTQPTPSSGHDYAAQFLTPPSATQPIARKSSRPFIAPPRVPNPSTPMSLADLFNELRRDRLQADEEERERDLARKRGAGSAKSAASHESTGGESRETGSPSQSQTSTPSLSSASRTIPRTPSLNDIRVLLARRNALSASQPARAEPASPIPMHLSNDEDGHGNVPESVAVSAPAPATPTPVHLSNDEDVDGNMPGSEPVAVSAPAPAMTQVSKSTDIASPKDATWSTLNPATTSSDLQATASGPDISLDASTSAKGGFTFVPFEAFISPARPRGGSGDKGKGKEVGHAAIWSRASLDTGTSPLCLSSQRPKHKARKSESDAFATYIVRDVAKQMADPRAHTGASTESRDTDTDTDANANTRKSLERSPLGRSRFPEGLRSLSLSSSSVASPEMRHTVPSASPVMAGLASDVDGDRDGEDGDVGDMGAIDVDHHTGDGFVDSTHTEEGAVLGEGEETRECGEADETETLSQLASVHLSLASAKPEPEPEVTEEGIVEGSSVDKVDKIDGMNESAESSGATEEEDRAVFNPEPQVVDESAMVVDEPGEEVEMSVCAPKTTLDEIPSPPNHTGSDAIIEDADSVEPTVANVIPRDDSVVSLVELPSISEGSDEDVAVDHTLQRPKSSGGVDSADECDALLVSRSEECELEELEGMTSSRTASSSSLVPPRTRSRSSRNNSKQGSPAASTRPVDMSDVTRQLDEYRTLTWASWVAEARERPPEYRLAKDLPHSLQDYINVIIPPALRNSDFGRKVFEAHIREAMTNEPDAPPIGIFDNEIGDEATPAWEFCYTNEMWFGERVPPPDMKGLQSCGCVGRCDPKSKTCACAQRQHLWAQAYIENQAIPPTWPGSPFVYDHRGLLQRLECCPIFECNRFCSCDDDCPNRVVQNGRKWPVHIAKTLHKGWGVFSGNKKIPKGSFIGIYAGELLTEQEGERRGRYYDLYGRTYLFTVDFHHLKLGMANPDDWENLYVVDAYHAGNFTRFLNHSCDPNCGIFACYIDDADINKPLLAIFTTRDVEPWEELCFSYYGDIEDKREEIQAARNAGEDMVREFAVHAKCRCEAENCIGRLFS